MNAHAENAVNRTGHAGGWANPKRSGGAEAYKKRLLRYLSGGGLGAFRRTAQQIEADERRERFLAGAVVLAVLWLAFWIF